MGAIGNRFQTTFATRMAQIGTTATVTKQVATSYSTATTVATPAGTTLTVKGVFDDSKKGFNTETPDTRLEDRIFLIPSIDANGSALTFTPGAGDSLTIGTQGYEIKSVDFEIADDVVVYYRLHVEQR